MRLRITALNTYGGIWTFVIAVCFILFLLFGANWFEIS